MTKVSKWRRAVLVFGVLLLPAVLGVRPGISQPDMGVKSIGETINPRYVNHIKNGQTKKHEILMYFGEPQEVERTPEGQVYKYFSYRDTTPVKSSKPEDRQPVVNSQHLSNPFYLDKDKNIKMVEKPMQGGKILRRSLTVRFKADGETVLTHEYREY